MSNQSLKETVKKCFKEDIFDKLNYVPRETEIDEAINNLHDDLGSIDNYTYEDVRLACERTIVNILECFYTG